MTVEAVALVKWKKDVDNNNAPDKLDDVIQTEIGNKWEDIGSQSTLSINGKITGNVKNLGTFKLVIGDLTWAAFAANPQIEWAWFHQTAPGATELDPPVVVDSNRDESLTAQQFSALVSWLTSNGFDASSLAPTDTRAEIVDKCIVIFQQ